MDMKLKKYTIRPAWGDKVYTTASHREAVDIIDQLLALSTHGQRIFIDVERNNPQPDQIEWDK